MVWVFSAMMVLGQFDPNYGAGGMAGLALAEPAAAYAGGFCPTCGGNCPAGCGGSPYAALAASGPMVMPMEMAELSPFPPGGYGVGGYSGYQPAYAANGYGMPGAPGCACGPGGCSCAPGYPGGAAMVSGYDLNAAGYAPAPPNPAGRYRGGCPCRRGQRARQTNPPTVSAEPYPGMPASSAGNGYLVPPYPQPQPLAAGPTYQPAPVAAVAYHQPAFAQPTGSSPFVWQPVR